MIKITLYNNGRRKYGKVLLALVMRFDDQWDFFRRIAPLAMSVASQQVFYFSTRIDVFDWIAYEWFKD